MERSQDIFKKRKSKVCKNLVSIGRYGVIAGAVTLSLIVAGTASADTEDTSAILATEVVTGDEASPDSNEAEAIQTEPTVAEETLTSETARAAFSAPEANSIVSADTETTPKEVTPSDVTLAVTGTDRNNKPVTDGSTINVSTVLTYDINVKLPDDIKSGDTLGVALPDYVAVNPTPYSKEITDSSGKVVATLDLVNNYGADKKFTGTTGQITFTDAYEGKYDNSLSFGFPVLPSSNWKKDEVRELKATIGGKEVTSGESVKLYVSSSSVFRQSHSLYPQTKPEYTFVEGSEVSIKNRDKDTALTLIYHIADDTVDYARYDVTKIREKGFTVRVATDRTLTEGYVVNTANNDKGITAVVDDEGKTLTITIPNLPAGSGVSIVRTPILMTDVAIAEADSSRIYNTVMEVYSYDEGTAFNANQEPVIAKYYANSYPFPKSSADSSSVKMIVNYRIGTENGPVLQDRTISDVRIGDKILVTPKEFDGYKLIKTQSNATGDTITKEINPLIITYVYQKIGADITVKYQDEQGNTLQADEIDTTGEVVGTIYDTQDHKHTSITVGEIIYDLIEKTYADESGTVSETPVTVVYQYAPRPVTETETKTTQLTVHYEGAGDATPEDKVVTVEWTREVTKNAATGEVISTTDWSSPSSVYPTVVTPEVANYTADKIEVSNETAADSDVDKVVVVTYTANQEVVTEILEKVTVKPNQTSYVTPKAQEIPYKPTYKAVDTLAIKHKMLAASVLPSTGDSSNGSMVALGLVGMLSALGLASTKRRKS